jgi:hypothetical protein
LPVAPHSEPATVPRCASPMPPCPRRASSLVQRLNTLRRCGGAMVVGQHPSRARVIHRPKVQILLTSNSGCISSMRPIRCSLHPLANGRLSPSKRAGGSLASGRSTPSKRAAGRLCTPRIVPGVVRRGYRWPCRHPMPPAAARLLVNVTRLTRLVASPLC